MDGRRQRRDDGRARRDQLHRDAADLSQPSLTITVQDKGAITAFISSAGECTVTIGLASGSQISGAFDCQDLSAGPGATVDATGSFNAQG